MKTIVESAAQRAAALPEHTLPCPRCAALVKGKNLVGHLQRVHDAPHHDDRSRPASWVGPERLVARPLVGLPVVAALVVVAAHMLGRSHDDRLIIGAGAAVGVGTILAAIATFDTRLFRGRLTVRSGRVVLAHTFGLRRRRLRRVDRLEFGPAYERKPDPIGGPASSSGGQASVDVASGSYLRMLCGVRHITVHCKHGATLRKTWTGWTRTGRRRRWHITLDAAQFVQLQYVLADLGLLTVRDPGR